MSQTIYFAENWEHSCWLDYWLIFIDLNDFRYNSHVPFSLNNFLWEDTREVNACHVEFNQYFDLILILTLPKCLLKWLMNLNGYKRNKEGNFLNKITHYSLKQMFSMALDQSSELYQIWKSL